MDFPNMIKHIKKHDSIKTEKAISKTRRTWFTHITSLLQKDNLDEESWLELEELLISADVGVQTSDKLLQRLRERIKLKQSLESNPPLDILKTELVEILSLDCNANLKPDEFPLILLVIGVNGVGKTTSIIKLANLYKQEGKKVVLGAADTFRAAAIEQLQTWAHKLQIDVIAHKTGADPGAVAFDTLQAAKSRHADVVIIDTAGRIHTKTNLMEEIKKIHRTISRLSINQSLKIILTLDATTGQNGLFQARAFTESVGCHGVFLTKLDGTAKGGIVLAITDELKLPILYIGTGEHPDDIATFNPKQFVEQLVTPSNFP